MALSSWSDDHKPQTIDQQFVRRCLKQLGYYPEKSGTASSNFLELIFPGYAVHFSFSTDNASVFCVTACMVGHVDLSRIDVLAQYISQWNAQRVNPTAFTEMTEDANQRVFLRSSYPVEYGATNAQLNSFLQITLAAMSLAAEFFSDKFPELLHPDTQNEEHTVANQTSDEEQESSLLPTEVTLERICHGLTTLGITKIEATDVAVAAWINDIFIAAFIESGPSLLVKGHWDYEENPDTSFMRCFLICNEWNAQHASSKAFCQRNDTEIYVDVEYVAEMGTGLNNEQLLHHLALSIHHILRCIDSISTELTGTTAVNWPTT